MQFGSDNQVGASESVMRALADANSGHSHGYGGDPWTERAVAALRATFECDLEAFFVLTGTAANSLALACLAKPWEAILCHDHSHIINDESTAPEFFSNGARLIGISGRSGKLEPLHLREYFRTAGTEYPHNARAAALSITQSSENGLVYTPKELSDLCAAARERNLRVHMDGARFANAVAAMKCTPAELSWQAGVDVLCLGATKNGAMAAEVVLCFDKSIAEEFIHRRKRSGHLLSKSRFVGAQVEAWLKDNHWLELARHANRQSAALVKQLADIPAVRLTWPADANEVFAILPKKIIERLRDAGAEFYEWPLAGLPPQIGIAETESYVRLVTSFATTDKEIEEFCAIARRA